MLIKKTRKPVKKITKRKSLDKDLDILYSRYIRLRDSDGKFGACYTCGNVGEITEMDNGHFISRAKKATKYDEMNTHLQCKRCNIFLKGNLVEYAIRLENDYGYGIIQDLKERSKQIFKVSDDFFKSKIAYYKARVKEMDVFNLWNY